MTTRGSDAGSFHTSRTTTNDHDFLRYCSRFEFVGLGAFVSHDTLCQSIHTAVTKIAVLLISANVAMKTARARSDFIKASRFQLVNIFGVNS